MAQDVTIYHNPRCSKSRATLQILHDNGVRPRVVEYLKTPPSESELRWLLARLGLTPRELMRRKEPTYAELALDAAEVSNAQLITALHEHPVLLERPIVVVGDRVALGRPPENVLQIL